MSRVQVTPDLRATEVSPLGAVGLALALMSQHCCQDRLAARVVRTDGHTSGIYRRQVHPPHTKWHQLP